MVKPWLAHYPKDVPEFIKPLEYTSLVDFFEQITQQYEGLTAFSHLGLNLDYSGLEKNSRYFANYLLSLNLERHSRVAIILPNCLQYPVVLFGILRAGHIVVNTNPLYSARELKNQLNDSGATVVVLFESIGHLFEGIVSQTSVKHVVITQMGDFFSWPKSGVINFTLKYIKKKVPDFNLPTAVFLNDTLNSGKQRVFDRPSIGLNDIAFLQYTGGTTGVSKGAMLSHANMLSNLEQIYLWITQQNKGEKELTSGSEIVITALPLYHIFALTANLLCFLKLGAENVLISDPRDISFLIKSIKAKKFTCITGVNTLFDSLLQAPDFKQIDFSALKLSVAGGMATREHIARQWKKYTGCILVESYGLTEASPAVTINPLKGPDFSNSIGQPLPSTECEIRDENNQRVPIGEIGELFIRGPQVMVGFWQHSDETQWALSEHGWLKSGDIAKFDTRGFLYLVDRLKDMILVSGFNVYPNEIESVVCAHPQVSECGAIGIPDQHSGEAVKIFVVRNDAALDKDQLMDYCQHQLTDYKLPRAIEFKSSLPKTAVGKILRRSLSH
jgi:long-chain acyl-CoA synthetase